MGGQVWPEVNKGVNKEVNKCNKQTNKNNKCCEAEDGMQARWVERSGLGLMKMMKRMTN